MTRGPRLAGIGAHHSANPQTDEWLTPPEIIAALTKDGCSPFDLDPCAPHQNPKWTGAADFYTASDDGLDMPWGGMVWCNPPYSDVEPWMRRMAQHGDGIALVFARCETRWWFEHVWPHAIAYLFLEGRLTFYRPDGTPSKAGHNAGGPSVLIAYGDRAARRLRHSGLPGALVSGATLIRQPR